MAPTNGTDNHAMVHSFEQVYGTALLELASEAKSVDPIADEVRELSQLIEAQPDLQRLLESQVLSVEERQGMLERLFKGKVSDLLFRFLAVVNAKNRLRALPGILRGFEQALEERRGIVEVDAFVAQKLDAREAQQVADRLCAALAKRVVLHQYVDPTLIGGLKIRVGDEVVDGSVATQLKIMREQLIDAGRDRARQQANAL